MTGMFPFIVSEMSSYYDRWDRVKTVEDIEGVKPQIAEAYEKIK